MSGRIALGAGLALLLLAGIAMSATLGDPASIVVPIVYGGAGAFVAFRRPSNPIGWLLILTGWGFGLGTLRVGASPETLLTGDLGPVQGFTAWANAAGFGLAFIGLVSLTAVFPDGRLPEGRWRLMNLVAIVATILIAAIIATYPVIVPTTESAVSMEVANPFALAPEAPLWAWVPHPNILYPATLVTIGVTGAGLVQRSRRAIGPARLQYRWFIAAVALVLATTSTWAVAVFVFESDALGPTWFAATFSFTAIPVAIAIAVLRYRLFEIDRIISRTLGWAVVSGILVAVFAGLVVGLQSVLAEVTQGQTLAVAASTLVAFALFQPVRRRVQSAVDRRFDRARYDGERTATAFAERLRDETDVGTLTGELRDTAGSALAPAALGIWLREVTR